MESRYHPGQVWCYKNAVREDSRAIVGQVEDLPGTGTVVSICVTSVYLPHAQTGEPTLNAISHAPMTPEAMDISVIEQTGTSEPIPEFHRCSRRMARADRKRRSRCFHHPGRRCGEIHRQSDRQGKGSFPN
jgi:hypothetical protein